ncbi:glycosyltransferase family 2 protein, partial [Leuconostoc pseudomesenteroides]|uniref:glycosyltransferase family 2 protein n=1 Tax=Leuconostoc pseudomesenteroides TaxID=33968 RepID=UPI0040370681
MKTLKKINNIINPLVSIIVPIYNGKDFIKRCLDSILNQTYTNIEIICVVNGSTDNSDQEVLKYVQNDTRVKLITSIISDLGTASNIGVNNAHGEYISFVDVDDWVNNQYVENLLGGISKGFRICKSNMDYFYGSEYKPVYSNKENGQYTLRDISWLLPCRQSAIYDKKLFENVKFLENSYYEDLATWPLLLGQVNEIYYINDSLYIYNKTNPHSIMNSSSSKHLVLDKVFEYIFSNINNNMNREVRILITALFIQSFWSSNIYLIK